MVGRVLLDGKSIQIPDVLADPEYKFREIARLGDFRTILGVPLIREGIQLAFSSCREPSCSGLTIGRSS